MEGYRFNPEDAHTWHPDDDGKPRPSPEKPNGQPIERGPKGLEDLRDTLHQENKQIKFILGLLELVRKGTLSREAFLLLLLASRRSQEK